MTLPVNIDSAILSPGEWGLLSGMSDELSHAYKARQIFRTDTEARVSVLDDLHHPTKAAKYWQAVREQTVMLEQLALLSFDHRRNELLIKRYTHAREVTTDNFEREEAQINLDECIFKRANIRTTASDRAREIAMWSKIKAELNDGSFDTFDVNSHQLVSYATRFALMAAAIDPTQMPAGEFHNLAGQLTTAMNRCEAMGVMDQVRANLPNNVVEQFKLGGV